MKTFLFSAKLTLVFMITSAFAYPPAIVTDYHDSGTGSVTFISPCNGESIAFTQSITTHNHSVINNSKANSTFHQRVSYTGIGDKGNTYHGEENDQQNISVTLSNGSYTFYQRTTVNLVSNGSAPNFIIHETYKVEVDQKGNTTVTKQSSTLECKG